MYRTCRNSPTTPAPRDCEAADRLLDWPRDPAPGRAPPTDPRPAHAQALARSRQVDPGDRAGPAAGARRSRPRRPGPAPGLAARLDQGLARPRRPGPAG